MSYTTQEVINLTTLRKNLSKLLVEAQISISQLEKQAGLSRYSIQNIMQGKSTKPSAETVASMAKHFGYTVEELLSDNMTISQEIPVKKSSLNEHIIALNKKFDFDLNLYNKTFNVIEKFIEKNNSSVSFWEISTGIIEIYQYSYTNNNKKLDARFANWWLNRNLKME